MLAIIGNITILAGSIFYLLYLVLSFIYLSKKNQNEAPYLANYIKIGFSFILFSFFILLAAFVLTDYGVMLVVKNSHHLKPLLYKISGVWGNHEGSMLLWILELSAYSLFALYLFPLKNRFNIRIHSVLALNILLFLFYVLLLSNPFVANFDLTKDGNGLNPLLQDIGLAIHPPILYLGYAGMSLPWAISIACLYEQHISLVHRRKLSKAAKFAWSMLTLGIGCGSWWAYRELGWGGYWFFDPVENASLMPWLTATALIHIASLKLERTLNNWLFLLSIITYCLCLFSSFLVRSGLLISVHSFVSEPARGMFLLIVLSIIGIFSFVVYGFKAHYFSNKIKIGEKVKMILANNFLLVSASLTVFFSIILWVGGE